MRKYALGHKDLRSKLHELEALYNRHFKEVYDALNYLLKKDKVETKQKERKPIGFNITKGE
ncbi:MAG: hypothetical protein WCO63_14570 [Bacteroidota bacterium]